MISKNQFIISKNIKITKNTHISKDFNFLIKEGVVLNIVKNGQLFLLKVILNSLGKTIIK